MIASLPPSVALQAFLDALENAGLGCTVVVDRGDRLERVYANAALARIFGIDLDTLRAMAPTDVLPDAQRERLAGLRTALGAERPGPLALETEIKRPDGTLVPVELGLGYGMLDGARATFVFLRDVSAKAAIATALRESEERFRRVAEASPDAITIHSGDKYVYANPVALRLLGLRSADDLPTARGWARVSADQRPMIEERMERIRAGEPLPPHQVRVTSEGKELVLEASVTFITIDGAPAIVSYARDITERIFLQAELMKQDRLASVGLLAAGVAHELNNPLTTLAMQARKLCTVADREGHSLEMREGLRQIDEAARRMNAIIADLLFMARPVEQPQAHVDIEQIVHSSVSLLRAGVLGCPPIHEDLQRLPAISAYASRLGQVLLNVLRNAVQAVEGMPDATIVVRARATEGEIAIEVADNGPGIPTELIARVTEPFFTTKPQGAGLGLWISRELMAQHGGRLDLTSVEKQGTRVTLWLPQGGPLSGE
jgi:PAS domain S-box-containing protein